MVRDKSGEKFSVQLPAELARALRDEADRSCGGDLSAALSAAVEQWARGALKAQGIAAIKPFEAGPGATRRPDRAPGLAVEQARGVDDGYDLVDPHMD